MTDKVVRWGWAAILLFCLMALPGLGQEEQFGDAWEAKDQLVTQVIQANSTADDASSAEQPAAPLPAIAPDGEHVLDYSPPLPRDDPASLLREILSQPEFQTKPQVQSENWLERLLRWLSSLPGVPVMGMRNWLGLSILALVLGLLTYLVVRLSWAGRLRRANSHGANAVGGLKNLVADYLGEADRAARNHDFRAAVRYRFLSVLQHAGIPDNQVMTNRQVQRELLLRSSAIKRPLVVLITGYEDVWYGQLECNQECYDRVREQAEAVERLLAQGEAA